MRRMAVDIVLPDQAISLEERGAVLRVTGVRGGPVEFRVDEGLVFARYLGQEPRLWTDVTLSSLMALYAADSPVATFLRQHGALPLRQLLLDSLTATGADDTDNAPA